MAGGMSMPGPVVGLNHVMKKPTANNNSKLLILRLQGTIKTPTQTKLHTIVLALQAAR
jgi:hypothetical protein